MALLRNNHGGKARLALLLPVLLIGGMLAAWAQTYRDSPYGARFGMANGTATTTIEADGDAEFAGTVTATEFVGTVSGVVIGDVSDSTFRIQDNGDATKEIAFQASGITTGTTRTVTMPDTNVNLGDIATNTAKVSNATHTGDVTGSTTLTIAAGAIDAPSMFSATGTADATTFLRGDNSWATPAGGGDMTLAGTQTVTGAKTFDDGTLKLDGATSGTTTIKAAAIAGTTTATFQSGSGTVAYTSDVPGDTDDLTEGSTNRYVTTADETKLGYITVTQAVNLDALESAVGGTYADNVFAIQDNGDATKQIAFQASGITTGTTRTITMPNSDVNLGALTDAQVSDTLTASNFVGSGSTSNALDLGTAEVDGDLGFDHLEQIAEARLLGRAASAGTGDVSGLTFNQIDIILNGESALTSTSNEVAWNHENGKDFAHLLTQATEIQNSSGGTPKAGQKRLWIIQQSAGGYPATWDTSFVAGADFGDTIPANSTTNGDVDLYLWRYFEGTTNKWVLLAHRVH